MDKISFMRLWDIYNGLLTPTQQELTNLYFNLDLTVSEIADEKGITRQAVSECLKNCQKQLEEYEKKLKFAGLVSDLDAWADKTKAECAEYAVPAEEVIKILQGFGGKADKAD